MVDEAVGGVRAAPSAAGPVQAFASDPGDHLVDYGLLLKGAGRFRQVTRVPFL